MERHRRLELLPAVRQTAMLTIKTLMTHIACEKKAMWGRFRALQYTTPPCRWAGNRTRSDLFTVRSNPYLTLHTQVKWTEKKAT